MISSGSHVRFGNSSDRALSEPIETSSVVRALRFGQGESVMSRPSVTRRSDVFASRPAVHMVAGRSYTGLALGRSAPRQSSNIEQHLDCELPTRVDGNHVGSLWASSVRREDSKPRIAHGERLGGDPDDLHPS